MTVHSRTPQHPFWIPAPNCQRKFSDLLVLYQCEICVMAKLLWFASKCYTTPDHTFAWQTFGLTVMNYYVVTMQIEWLVCIDLFNKLTSSWFFPVSLATFCHTVLKIAAHWCKSWSGPTFVFDETQHWLLRLTSAQNEPTHCWSLQHFTGSERLERTCSFC